MAENIGRAKIEVGADTRKAQMDLERFRQRLEMAGRSYDKLLKEDVTRKFSENFRKGFELGVLRGVTKGENQFYQLNRAINVAASALNKIKSPAEMASDRFMRLQRTGLKFQAAAGIIAGTIGDLVGGLLSLVGVLGAAVPAIAAFGGAFAGVAVGFIGVKVAMAGVANAIGTVWKSQTALNDTFRAAAQEYINLKFAAEAAALSQEDAALKLESAREALARVQDLPPDNRLRRQTELAYKQADLQLREAKHKSEEAFRAVKKGIEATSAYQPLAPLSKMQLEFVKFMVTLRPQMQQLKKEVAEGFIPKLQESIQTLMKYGFPVLKTGLKQVASAMGDASKTFASAFKDTTNMEYLKSFFESSTKVIAHFGNSMKSSFGILLTILKAAAPITERFSAAIDTALSNLEEKLKLQEFNGDLRRTFELAYDVARSLGGVFREIYGGIKNIVKAAFPSGPDSGAGKVMLDFLHSISKGFESFTGSKGFSNWLKESTINAVEALRTIGQFLKIFVDLAGNQDTRKFWITLRGAIPYVRQILEAGQKAGEAVANVLVSLSRMIAALADESTITTFFNTLSTIMNTFASVLEFLRPVLTVIGAMHGPLLAIAGVFILLKKGLEIFLGYIAKFMNMMGSVTAKLKADKEAVRALKTEYMLAGQAGQDMFNKLRMSARTARNSQLLTMGREAGFARDRLAQLELQLISGSKAAYLYNERTKQTTQMLQMSIIAKKGAITEAQLMTNRILAQASAAGFDAQQVKALNTQIQRNIEELRRQGQTVITNQQLIAGTGLAGGRYKAAYANTLNAPGPAGVPMAPGLTVGANATRGFLGTVGRGIQGGFSRLGGGSIAGGIGMGLTGASALYSMASGTMSQTGMMMQGVAGIASMFGPGGMVVGSLLSIGTTIVDSINAAQEKQAQRIKKFEIISAEMVVQNLNQVQKFGEKAAAAGFAGNKYEAEAISSSLFNKAAGIGAKYDVGLNEMQNALQEFALSNKTAYKISTSSQFAADTIAETVGKLSKTSTLDINSIAGALGTVSSMTAKTSTKVINDLVKTSLIGRTDVPKLLEGLKFDASGVLTNYSFKQLMTKIATASAGLQAQGATGTGTGQFTTPTFKYKALDMSSGMSLLYNNMLAGGGSLNKTQKETAIQDLSTLMGGKSQNIFKGGKFVDQKAMNTAANSVSRLAELLTGVAGSTITKESVTGRMYRGTFYTQSELNTLKTTNKQLYNSIKNIQPQIIEGFNVAGTFFQEGAFSEALRGITLRIDGADVSAADYYKGDRLNKLGSVLDVLNKNLIPSAAPSADATAFKTSTTNISNSAVKFDKAADKLSNVSDKFSDSVARSQALSVVLSSAAGQLALKNNRTDIIDSMVKIELNRMGVKVGG